MTSAAVAAYGAALVADLPLPELAGAPRATTDHRPVVHLRADPVLAARPAVGADPVLEVRTRQDEPWIVVHRVRDASWHLAIDGSLWATVTLPDASGTGSVEVRYRHDEGLDAASVRHLLLDQVVPRALSVAGVAVLHAAAAVPGGGVDAGAVAFLGPSGIGKSTLSVALGSGPGASLVADDTLRLDRAASGLTVHPSYASARLWQDAAAALDATRAPTGPVAHYTPKQRYPVAASTGPRRLALAYLVDNPPPEQPDRVRAEPLDVAARVRTWLEAAFVLDPDHQRVALFELATSLADALPLQRLEVPDDLGALPTVVDLVRAAWAAGGHG